MLSHHRWMHTLSAVSAFALAVVAWLLFAPLQIGGQAGYVIVQGNSMEPVYHRGDLVIVRAVDKYQIGDIATYRDPRIGLVIHRIIARDGERFAFQGDHNDWVDSYRPLPTDVVGKFWIHLPSVGKLVAQLRSPRYLAVLVAVMAMIAMTATAGETKRRRRRRPTRLPTNHYRLERGNLMKNLGAIKEQLLVPCALLAVVLGLLGIVAFTRAATHTVTDQLAYEHAGRFTYSAAVPPGIYDSTTLETGQPVFRQVTDKVTFNFAYNLVAEHPSALAGSYRLLAEVSTINGWKRTLELKPETAFTGSGFSASSVLELAQVQGLIDGVEHQLGLQTQHYTLAVIPQVTLKGTLAGQSLQDTFAPRLTFQLDRVLMQLVREPNATGDLLKPSKQGIVERSQAVPNTLPLVKLPVATARMLALIGLPLTLAGLLALGLPLLWQSGTDEATRIRRKYGRLLIKAAWSEPTRDERVVQVATIDDLAKLAEQQGQLITYEVQGPNQVYVVRDGAVSYRYQVAAGVAMEPSVNLVAEGGAA